MHTANASISDLNAGRICPLLPFDLTAAAGEFAADRTYNEATRTNDMRLGASLTIALAVAASAAACGDSGTSPDTLSGTWGGEHVRLTLTSDGGQLDFDCARGVMNEALVPGADGRYSVAGFYIPEQGGPVREDGGAGMRRPTMYSGQVSGSMLTLRFVIEGDLIYGPYTLTRDRQGVVRKCL